MRKTLSVLFLVLGVGLLYAVENVTVDSRTRDVLNTGLINFGPGQLQVADVAVVPGGGGGPGGGVNSISLSFPEIFATSVSFVSDGLANWSATAPLKTQSAFTFFGNGNGTTDVPTFISQSQARIALNINNLDNTSDAAKPISTAQATANSTFTSGISDNTNDIASLTSTVSALTLSSIAAPTADVSVAGFEITNLADPTGPNHAANKQYVDAVAAGGVPHTAVVAATTANGTLASAYENGDTVDGVTLATNDRILLKNQTTGSENGIYVVAASGAPTRATDADTGAEVAGSVFVSGGTANAATTWAVITPQPITIDSTSIAYTVTGANTVYTASGGITLGGSNFALSTMGANTVKGNNTGSTAAPTNIAASTVGFNFLGLTNPSAITFPRINADNTVTARSAANFRSDIGAGTVTNASVVQNNSTDLLAISVATSTSTPAFTIDKASVAAQTFFGNSSGSSGVPGFMSAATSRTTLGATTVGANVFTLTNPSAVTFPRFNADNTVSALTAAQALVALGGATVESQMNFANSGTTGTPSTWTTGATAAFETAALPVDRYAFLPPSTSYTPGKRITYTDALTTANVGRYFRPASGSGDMINNSTSDYRPFIAGTQGAFGRKSVEFEAVTTVGGISAGWQVVNTPSTVLHVEDASDAMKQFTFSAALQQGSPAPSPGQVIPPAGVSYTVLDSDTNVEGWVQNITGGQTNKVTISQHDVHDGVFSVGTKDQDYGFNNSNVTPTDGSVSKIRVAGNLIIPLSINLPPAGAYRVGETIILEDFSGTVGPSGTAGKQAVSIKASGTDTFNYGPAGGSFTWDETNGRKALSSDAAGNWAVSLVKVSNQPYKIISAGANNTFTVVVDQSATVNRARIQLLNGANNLAISGSQDGAQFDIFLMQPPSGAAGSLALPIGSTVGGGGLGVLVLSNTNGKKDRLTGSYDGNDNSFNWDLKTDYSSSVTPTAPNGLTTGTVTASKIPLTWTDNSNNENGFEIYRCSLASCTNFAPLATTLAGVTSYDDFSVTSDTSYTYKVRAFNSGGRSAFSSTATATTSTGGPTADLWEVHFNDGSGNNTAVATIGPNANVLYSTDWTASSLPSGSTGAALNVTAGMTPTTGTTVTPTCSGTCSTAYTYRVLAWKTSPSVHNGWTGAAITGTNAAILDATHFNHITWSAVTGADYYTVYRVTSGGTPTSIGALIGATNITSPLSFDDNGVTANLPVISTATTDIHGATSSTSIDYTKGGSLAGNLLSVSFWCKSTYTGTTTANDVFSGGSNSWRINFINSGATGKLQITYPRGGGTETGTVALNVDPASTGNNINSGTGWHLVTVTMDNSQTGNGVIGVYLDGNHSATVTSTAHGTTAKVFSSTAPQVGSSTFAGTIKDGRIYGRILSGVEAQAIYDGNAQ